MLTKPWYGWSDFQIGSSPFYPLSYYPLTLPFGWLEPAIEGLENDMPFTVEAGMEPELLICEVSKESCHLKVYSDEYPVEEEKILDETYHISMIEFCKSLYCDFSEFFDEWADFEMNRDLADLEEPENGEEPLGCQEIRANKEKLKSELERLHALLSERGVDPEKRTIDEMYSRIRIRRLSEVVNTHPQFDWKYCPVVIDYPGGYVAVGCGGGDETAIHIKFAYMLELWKRAMAETEKEYPGFLAHEWYRRGYFNALRYTNENHGIAVDCFIHKLEKLADSGEIKVKEKLEVDEKNNLTLTCRSYGSFAGNGKHYSDRMRAYKCSDAEFTYKWKEVRKHFIQLSASEVAMFYGSEMNPYDPKNDVLHKACEDHDYQAVVKAVEAGADVNGFDKYGETPLNNLVAENTVEDGLEQLEKYDPEYTDNIIRIMDYLVSKGANINLYGFDGDDILELVHFSGNLRVMKHLCELGIRKDLNCFICDFWDGSQWYTPNAAYNYIETDIAIGFEYDTPNIREQEKILEEYGINNWLIDGWTNNRLDEYYNSLPNLYVENPE